MSGIAPTSDPEPVSQPPANMLLRSRNGRPLRVVHLGKYYPPSAGGIETHTRELARAQADLGADVTVVVVNHATAAGRDATFDRLTRTATVAEWDGPVKVVRVGRLANVAKLDLAVGLPAALRRVMRAPPDVWHLHTPNPTMLLAAAARPRLAPLVVTHHSDVVKQRLLRHAVEPFERVVYRRAARVLPTSIEYAAGSPLLRRFADKLTPVPLGIDLDPYRRPSPAALAAAAGFRRRFPGPLWLAVGRLIYYKGFHVAVDALARSAGTLLVIGTGPLEGELRRRADGLGAASRVHWLGRASADDLAGAYRAATALWFPSVARSEGFGLVQVEAMASGCPVINSAVPGSGVAWVCRHDREGLTVPVGDAAALAAAATRLAADAALRARLGAAGKVRAAAEFDRRVMAERTLAVYREAVASRRDGR